MPVPNSDVTVVIPAYGPSPHLPRILEAIGKQTLLPTQIIVAHSGLGDPTAAMLQTFPAVRVLHQRGRMVAAAARNKALAEVRTNWTAFLDSDVIPTPGWLTALHDAANAKPDRFVVGAIGAAGNGGYWGMCLWAIEFSGVNPTLPDREVQGGASANMMVRTSAVRHTGGFDASFVAGEDSLLAAKLRDAGLCNWFCAAARGDHVNISGLRHFVTHLFWLGCWSARCRRRVRLRGSVAARWWPLAPGLWLARLGLIYTRMLRWDRSQWRLYLVLAPGIVLGVLIWNGGFMSGLMSRNGTVAP